MNLIFLPRSHGYQIGFT